MISIKYVASFSYDSEALGINFPYSHVKKFIRENFYAGTLLMASGVFEGREERSLQLVLYYSRIFGSTDVQSVKDFDSLMRLQEILGQKSILIEITIRESDDTTFSVLLGLENNDFTGLDELRKVIDDADSYSLYLKKYRQVIHEYKIPLKFVPKRVAIRL